jgi:hypothetical protein
MIMTSFRNEVGGNIVAMANSEAAGAGKIMQGNASGMNRAN